MDAIKANKGITAFTLDIDYDQTAIGLPPVMSAVFIASNFGKTWAKNIRDASATPSRIKREWYVCISANTKLKV
jgi:hypothetical protein